MAKKVMKPNTSFIMFRGLLKKAIAIFPGVEVVIAGASKKSIPSL